MKAKEIGRREVGLYAVELPRGRGYAAHVLYDVDYSDGTHRVERGPDIFTMELLKRGLYDAARVAALGQELLMRSLSARDEKLRKRRRA